MGAACCEGGRDPCSLCSEEQAACQPSTAALSPHCTAQPASGPTTPVKQQMPGEATAPEASPTTSDCISARFVQFVQLLHWLTCGVPLLVREALRAALWQQAQQLAEDGRSWSQLCASAMQQRFTAPGNALVTHLLAVEQMGGQKVNSIVLDRLDLAEKKRTLLQVTLGIRIQLSALQDASSALARARIYTTWAEVDKDCEALTS